MPKVPFDDRDEDVMPIKDVCKILISNLSTSLTKDPLDKTLLDTKIWCLYVLRDQSGGWKSVLKAMVQFCDLWIDEMTSDSALDTFAVLISEALVKELYCQTKRLLNIFEYYNGELIQFNDIKRLCLLLQKSFCSISRTQDLLCFRDFVLRTELRKSNGFIEDPTYGRLDIWTSNFEVELMKATNKIVLVQEVKADDSLGKTDNLVQNVPETLVHNLASLSVIWPYRVLKELVLLCFQNRNMYLAIVPLLRNLGRLCSFRKDPSTETLLGTILREILYSDTASWATFDARNITLFITACCQDPFNPTTPPLLLEYGPTDIFPQILLDAKEYLKDYLLDTLDCFRADRVRKEEHAEVTSFRLALQTLKELSDSKGFQKSNWVETIQEKFQSKKNIEKIAILQAKPFEFVRCFSHVMNMRNTRDLPEWIRVQDIDAMLRYFKGLVAIIPLTLDWISWQPASVHDNPQSTLSLFIKAMEKDASEFLRINNYARHDYQCTRIRLFYYWSFEWVPWPRQIN
ncbi:hypothetical protein CLU79DRAFT_88872 [Phycomyces nitens]|nr:hypothetical protein CLU79DRAFT_88872 [Phycomyces nitens]